MNAQALQENEIYFEQLNCCLEVVSTGTKIFMRASTLAPVFFPHIKDSAEQKEALMQTLQEKILTELPVCSVEMMFCYTSFVIEDIIIDDYEISDKGVEKIFSWFKEHSALDTVLLLTVEMACMKLFQSAVTKIHFRQWQDLYFQNESLEKELHKTLLRQTEQLEKNLQLEKAYKQFLQNMLELEKRSRENAELDILEEFYNALRKFLPVYEKLTA